jgi:hypothetical protein
MRAALASARAPDPRVQLLGKGLRPEEIAQKLGLSSYAVTQIILASRNRGKL